MYRKVARMVASRIECIHVRPSRSIPSSTRPPIKLYYLRDEGFAWLAWGLVSMLHHPSYRQLLMLSWWWTSAYSGQHLPILMMCMWTRILCLRHMWRSISTALASSARSRRGYRMVRKCLCCRSGERITLSVLEKREQNPRHALSRHATEHIFTMQQIGWAPSHG